MFNGPDDKHVAIRIYRSNAEGWSWSFVVQEAIASRDLSLSDRQISILGNYDRHKIHHRTHRRSSAQVSVNQKPDIARERGNVLADPDEIVVSVPDKAGQAGHTHAGPHGDQVLADVVQFAGHRTVAGNAEQP